jgi:transposase
MEEWTQIRRQVLVEGVAKRQVLRDTGIHWQTLQKILTHSSPPGYRLSEPRPEPKIGPFKDRITQIIETDKEVPKKQRHTAKRIFERLKTEGYTGGYTQIKAAVVEITKTKKEVFVPLIHRPGEAQVDFGFALAKIGGLLKKITFFVMCLPHSDAVYVQAFPRICTEVMWEGHIRAFFFFGGVPSRISYDNDRTLVGGILGPRDRKLTNGFLQLKSHYLFDHHFCLIRRPNEKGVVESMVRYTRSNYLVPVPEFRDMEALNAYLEGRCREELARTVRGKQASKAELLKEDKAAFRPLPDQPFEACRKLSTNSDSLSLVRFDRNQYSVPVDYAHSTMVIKGYTDRVEICQFNKQIASHKRLWEKDDISFEPVHYLRLLERKPGALDHARPLDGWELPESFSILRRRLENDLCGEGTREYIRVLRLLERHDLSSVRRAVEEGLKINAHTRDAIAQFLFPREDWRLTTFQLDGRDHLRHVKVAMSDIGAYSELLLAAGGGL